jgi:hypothetical protein
MASPVRAFGQVVRQPASPGAPIYGSAGGRTCRQPLLLPLDSSELASVCIAVSRAGHLDAWLIWTAHIGFDRMLGYGLKYPTRFKDTHLNPNRPAPEIGGPYSENRPKTKS